MPKVRQEVARVPKSSARGRVQGLRPRSVPVVQDDVQRRQAGEVPELHLTHTPTCPHSGKRYGYSIYWANYGGSGVSGLEPLATVAKLFELVLRHGERDRECAKWDLDGDGLAVTKRGEA